MRAEGDAALPGWTLTGTGGDREPGRLPPVQGPVGRSQLSLRHRRGATTVLTLWDRVITTAIRPLSTCSSPAAAMMMRSLHWSARIPAPGCPGGPR